MSFENILLGQTSIEIIDGDRGKNYPKQNEFADKGYCLFLSTKNVTTEGFEFSEKNFISLVKDSLLRKGKLQRGDIVLTTRGTVGNVAYYHNQVQYDCIRINSGMVILRVNKNEFSPDFVHWLFRSSLIQNQIKLIKTGSAQPQLPIMIMKNLVLLRPVLDNQHKISSILSALDDKIELNNRMNKVLEQMAQAIFKQWFVDFEFPNENGDPYKSSGGEMEWCAELGKKIPKGWKAGRASDLLDVLSGGTPKTDIEEYWNGDIPFFTPKDCSNSFYSTETEKSVTELGLKNCNSKLYPPGTVFITARGTVGKLTIAGCNMAMNQSCYALKSKSGFTQIFIFLQMKELVRAIQKTASGAVFDAITVNTFKNLVTVVPMYDVVIQFDKILAPLFSKLLNDVLSNRALASIRDTLLPKLMSGEIDVSEIEL